MRDPEKGKSEGILAITNTQSTKVRLTLEPWADEHVVTPGKTVEVSYSGPSGGRMEIELKPAEMILYGWEGSVFSVRDGGKVKAGTVRYVFAVVRYDAFQDASVLPQNRITVTKVLSDEEAARAEVDRLNQLNEGKGCIYFWQATSI